MPARSLYFVNWWFDTLVIGGLSILAWLGLSRFSNASDVVPMASTAFALSFVANYPHFSATVYRLYQNPGNIREFPVTAIGLPLLLIGVVFAGLWQPRLIAPYILLLYLVWSPYHYSGQTIGLTMVYARRAGFHIGQRQRLALSTFVFSAFVCGVIRAQQAASGGIIQLSGLSVPALTLPPWLYAGAEAMMATGALVFGSFVLAWCIEHKRLLPPIVLLPAVTHFIWFVPGAGVKSFVLIIPAFHSFQYLLIALVMQLHRRTGAVAPMDRRRLAAEALRWALHNVLGGILLFIGLPVALIALHVPTALAFGLIVAVVNIHHFFVDGVIWKLRDSSTSTALMTSLAEMGGPAIPVPARV